MLVYSMWRLIESTCIGEVSSGSVTFSLTQVANTMKCSSSVVHQVLVDLQSSVHYNTNATSIIIETSGLSYHLLLKRHVNNEEKDTICEELLLKVKDREQNTITSLHHLYLILKYISKEVSSSQLTIRDVLSVYFKTGLTSDYLQTLGISISPATFSLNERDRTLLCHDIQSFLSINDDTQFTGRAIARIFQGIGSPKYPSQVWGQCPSWRKHLNIDFNTLCDIAKRQILKLYH